MLEFTAAAFCAAGAEKVVSNELKKLSAPGSKDFTVLESLYGRVRFKTDLAGLYRALMSLRAADRLLLEAGNFPAPDFDALFEGVSAIPWEDFIPRGMGLKVSKVRSAASLLKAETSIQAVVHKAAAQRLCERFGIRRLPEGSDVPQAELRVFIEKNRATVLLDLSGEPLFKRGYRPAGGIAPLRETTAAAIILLSGWKRKFPLCDPLCGSGTIIIEAALYAWDLAPGIGRRFTLSDLAFGDRGVEETVRRALLEKIDYTRPINIRGSDADEKAVALAKANLRRAQELAKTAAGAGKIAGIEFTCLPMKDASSTKAAPESSAPVQSAPASPVLASSVLIKKAPRFADGIAAGSGAAAGFIITNPPYGNRIGEVAEAEARYAEMAVLSKNFPGWKLALITDHQGFESHFGKKADSCRGLKSGAADAWLYQYEKI